MSCPTTEQIQRGVSLCFAVLKPSMRTALVACRSWRHGASAACPAGGHWDHRLRWRPSTCRTMGRSRLDQRAFRCQQQRHCEPAGSTMKCDHQACHECSLVGRDSSRRGFTGCSVALGGTGPRDESRYVPRYGDFGIVNYKPISATLSWWLLAKGCGPLTPSQPGSLRLPHSGRVSPIALGGPIGSCTNSEISRPSAGCRARFISHVRHS